MAPASASNSQNDVKRKCYDKSINIALSDAMLSVFDKLLEKLMYSRLYNHLQVNNVLYKYQFVSRWLLHWTVEEPTTATRSYSISTNIPRPEVHRQLNRTSCSQPILAPTSQIRTGNGILLSPSDQLPVGTSSLTTVVIHPPKESSRLTTTRTGNRNPNHVMPCGCMCTSVPNVIP